MTERRFGTCQCVADHRPAHLRVERHHVWPLGMGGPDIEANRVDVCCTTHDNVHAILALMVKDRQYASWAEVTNWFDQPVSRYAYQLALLGYRRWTNHALA